MRCQLREDVVQIVGVRVAVARQVGAKLSFVVDLVPHHSVRLARGAGRPNGEDEAAVPCHDQQFQNLPAFVVVREVAMSWEPSCAELLARVGMLIGLDACRNVVDDADGFGIRVTREAMGDHMVLHLPWRLSPGLLPIDGFTCGALKTAILIAVVVHGHQAQQMVHVTTLAKFAHQLWLDASVL